MIRAAKQAVRGAIVAAFRAYVRALPSPPLDPAAVRKILVPAYAGIGNVVLYTPALRAIRGRFPGAEIVLAVGNSRSNEAVLGPDLVDRVVEIPLERVLWRRPLHVLRAIRRVRRERFDLCVNAFSCYWPFHVALTAFGRVPWRCGQVSSPGWRGTFDEVYNIPAVMEADQYEVDRYLELAYVLGVPREGVDRRPSVHVPVDARRRAGELLGAAGVAPGDALVAVHAGTSAVLAWKQWGLERFEEVVLRLARQPGLKFALVGAPDERVAQADLVGRLSAQLPGRLVDLVGATDVPTLAAVIERAVLLVGNDSGPMQIAVALRVPVVVPWGPSDLPRNAPRDPLHTVLFKGLPCSPCYHMPGDSRVHLCAVDRACLREISVDDVASAAEAQLVRIAGLNRVAAPAAEG